MTKKQKKDQFKKMVERFGKAQDSAWDSIEKREDEQNKKQKEKR
jgi:hypothetical protein